jgi:excisionase family DNA binding protein
MMYRMLRVDEVACRLACSTRTVRRWIADGSLKSVKVHGLRLVPEPVLEEMVCILEPTWLDEHAPQAAAEETISAPALNPSPIRSPKTNPHPRVKTH